jgi:LCP family protein required for cell wall assembly
MSNEKKRPSSGKGSTGRGRAYTGKTIVMPQQKPDRPAPPPVLPPVPRVYQNPPPSQRDAQTGKRKAERSNPRSRPASPAPERQQPGQPRPASRPTSAQAAAAAPRRSTWRKVRRGLLLLALAVLAVLLVGGGLLYSQAHAVAESVVVPEARNNPPLQTPLLGGTTVLLVGVDERPDHPEEGVRSDTLIVARMNALGQWVSLLSVPRDTQVEIPGVGPTKINVAYGEGYTRAEELYGAGTSPQQGGMALAAQTVEQFLALPDRGMRIDYIAQVNFEGFVCVIDALGGITVDVPTYLIDYEYPTPDLGTMVVDFQPGEQRMDGQTALIYARTRHPDSDFGRAERQQQVIRAIISELQARDWTGRIATMPDVLNGIKGEEGATPPVLTTLPFDRPDALLALAYLGSGLAPDSIHRVQISPENVGVTEVGTNLIWDQAGVRAQVDNWLNPPAE